MFDETRFRETLEKNISQASGMDVRFGALDWGYNNGFAIKCVDLVVRSPSENREVFSSGEVYFNIALTSLLQGEVKINEATLVRPQARILSSPQKKRSLPPPVSKEPQPQPSQKSDAEKLKPNRIKNFLNTSEFEIPNIFVRDGIFYLVQPAQEGREPAELEMKTSLEIHVARTAAGLLEVILSEIDVQSGALHLTGSAVGRDLLGKTPSLKANLDAAAFSLDDLRSFSNWVPENFQKFLKPGLLEGQVLSLDAKIETPLTSEMNQEFLKNNLQAILDYKLKNIVYTETERAFHFSLLEGTGNYKNRQIQNQFSGAAGLRVGETNLSFADLAGKGEGSGGTFRQTLSGRVLGGIVLTESELSPSKIPGAPPRFASNIRLSDLDLDQLSLPKKDKSAKAAGKVSGEIEIEGFLNAPQKASLKAKLTGSQLAFENDQLQSRAESIGLKIRSISLPVIKADVDVKNFSANNYQFNKIVGQILASPQKVVVKSARLLPPNGTVDAKGSYDLSAQSYALNLDAKGLHLGDYKQLAAQLDSDNPPELSGKVAAKINLHGSLDKPETARLKGNVTGLGWSFKNTETATRLDSVRVGLSSASLPNIQTDFLVKNFSSDAFRLKKIVGRGNVSPQKIILKQGELYPAHGVLKARAWHDLNSKAYFLEFEGNGLRLEDYFEPNAAGKFGLKGTLNGDLTNPEALRGLSGKIWLDARKGRIQNLNEYAALLNMLNARMAAKKSNGIEFDYFGGDVEINRGVAVTHNLKIDGSQIKALAAIKTDLVAENLAGEVKVMPLQLIDAAVKAIPLLGRVLTSGKKGGLLETYFKLGGTYSQPQVTLLKNKTLLGKPLSVVKETLKLPGALVKEALPNSGP